MTPSSSNASWFAVRHVRKRQFRWMSLVELSIRATLAIIGMCALAIVVVITAIMTGGLTLVLAILIILMPLHTTSDLTHLKFFGVWLLDYWQELYIEERDGDGLLISQEVLTPNSADERDQAIAQVLDRAAAQNKMVREVMGGFARGGAKLWYGAMPFFTAPQEEPTDRLIDRVRAEEVSVERTEEGVVLGFEGDDFGRFAGVLRFLLMPMVALLPMIGILGPPHFPTWEFLIAEPWDMLLGRGPEIRTVTIRGGSSASVRVQETVGKRVKRDITVPGRDLMGVTDGPTLAFERGAMVTDGHPCLLTRRTRVPLPLLGPYELQSSIAALVSTLIAEEMAGALSLTERPLSCPFCATSYRMQDHERCPSCGHGAVPAQAI